MFDIFLSSKVDRKNVFAEIHLDDIFIAEINQEQTELELIVYSYNKVNLVMKLNEFINAIDIAKKMLLDPSTHRE
jgi:hypothetical protein